MLLLARVLPLLMLLTQVGALASPQLRMRRLGLDQGLPQSDVHAITQSTDGFIWIGTQNGLCRYDGESIDVFRSVHGVRDWIPRNQITQIRARSGGDLDLYARFEWWRYRARFDDFVPIAEPVDYVKANPADPLFSSDTLCEFTDSQQRRWVGTRTRGAFCVDVNGRRTRFSTTEKGTRHLLRNDIWAIAEDKYGRIWIGTNGGGVAIVQGNDIVSTLLNQADNLGSIPSNVVRTIFRDHDDVMWVGTFGGGACFWDPSNSGTLLYRWPIGKDQRFDRDVRSMAVDSKRRLYVGTRAGIFRFDDGFTNQQCLASWAVGVKSYGAVRTLYIDRFDNLWIGTERNGLGVLRKGSSHIRWLTGEFWNASGYLNSVYVIRQIGRDSLIVSGSSYMALIDVVKGVQRWIPSPGLENGKRTVSPVTGFYVVPETGEHVVSTETGLYRGHIDTGFTFIKCSDAGAIRSNIDIMRAVNRRGDTLYAGTWGGGIRKFHLPSWRETLIDNRHGLPDNTVYVVVPRSDGSFVASSNSGIILWSSTRSFSTVNVEGGAQANEFNTGAWLRTDDDRVFLGGINGINVVTAAMQPSVEIPNRLYVRSVLIDGKDLPLRGWTIADGLSLASGKRNVTIRIGCISTARPSNPRYRWRLLPIDSTWTVSEVPIITYNQLPGRNYELEVESSFIGDRWGARIQMPISITPVFYESWWFFIGAAIVSTLFVIVSTNIFTRHQLQKRRERELLLTEERERIARDLHDDIGANLARIVVVVDELRAKPDLETQDLQRVSDIARHSIDGVRSIVWVMKSNSTSFQNTMAFIVDKANDVLSDRGIDVSFDMPVVWPSYTLTSLVSRNIILACQEATTNIVRHSQATQVIVGVLPNSTHVKILIADNGIGMTDKPSGYSSGMANMQSRMREIGGTFEIQSGNGAGTRVVFTIPVARLDNPNAPLRSE